MMLHVGHGQGAPRREQQGNADDGPLGQGPRIQICLYRGHGGEPLPLAAGPESPDGIEEERRLFYVALTRAKVAATLSYAEMRFRWGNMEFSRPSCFLSEIDPRYVETEVDLGRRAGCRAREARARRPSTSCAAASTTVSSNSTSRFGGPAFVERLRQRRRRRAAAAVRAPGRRRELRASPAAIGAWRRQLRFRLTQWRTGTFPTPHFGAPARRVPSGGSVPSPRPKDITRVRRRPTRRLPPPAHLDRGMRRLGVRPAGESGGFHG